MVEPMHGVESWLDLFRKVFAVHVMDPFFGLDIVDDVFLGVSDLVLCRAECVQ